MKAAAVLARIAHELTNELQWTGLEYICILELPLLRATLLSAQMGTLPLHKHLGACVDISIISAFSVLYF